MPFSPAVTAAAAAALAVALSTIGALSSPVAAKAAPQGKSSSSSAVASGPAVRFDLRLTRIDEATTGAPAAAAAPALLAVPTLTTFAGQTAAMNVSGGEPSFSVSLSPSLERSDNRRQAADNAAAAGTPGAAPAAAAPPSGPAVRVLWNLRLAGKGLPGGVANVTMNGATRVLTGVENATIAEVALTDPATGKISRYRLAGKVSVGEAAEAAPAPAAPTTTSAARP